MRQYFGLQFLINQGKKFPLNRIQREIYYFSDLLDHVFFLGEYLLYDLIIPKTKFLDSLEVTSFFLLYFGENSGKIKILLTFDVYFFTLAGSLLTTKSRILTFLIRTGRSSLESIRTFTLNNSNHVLYS